MKFLFIGPGYPGVKGTSHGSGIGTYLREITLGLIAKGHACHVIAWGDDMTDHRPEISDRKAVSSSMSNVYGLKSMVSSQDGIPVFLLKHSYWPLIERIMPDSRDVWNMRQLAKRLDAEYHYDWIEIQSEEGIGIGVQREFPDKTILRVHTTLRQMVEYKGAGRKTADHRPQTADQREENTTQWGDNSSRSKVYSLMSKVSSALQGRKLRYRLGRERRSFAIAKRIVTHSETHAEEIKRLYPGIVEPVVVWHGIGPSVDSEQCAVGKSRNDNVAPLCERMSNEDDAHQEGGNDEDNLGGLKRDSNMDRQDKQDKEEKFSFSETSCKSCISMLKFPLDFRCRSTGYNLSYLEDGIKDNHRSQIGATSTSIPTFLIVGTPDRRKGFDRIRPVLEAYAAKFGPCRVVIVAGGASKETTDLRPQTSDQIVIEWKSGLSNDELASEYDSATLFLHLARYESFGIPLIEAASHGLPVVSTRVGIAPELLAEELSFGLVEGAAPNEVADALWQAAQRRSQLSPAIALRHALCFSRQAMTDAYLTILEAC